MIGCRVALSVLLLLLFGPEVRTATLQENRDGSAPAFARRGDQVEKRYRSFVARLSDLHENLLAILPSQAPDLIPLLTPEPPEPLPFGYQMLPKWVADLPSTADKPAPPAPVSYSWRRTEGFIDFDEPRVQAEAERLAAVTQHEPARRRAVLQEIVAQYLQLEKDQRLIDQHIQYNRLWQKAIADDPARFKRETELYNAALERQNLLVKLQETDLPPDERLRLGALERERAEKIHGDSEPLVPRFVRLSATRTGWILRVRVYSDILDDAFLAEVKRAIEHHWRIQEGNAEFRIEVDIRNVQPRRLYPGTPPRQGAPIDLNAHVERFPQDGGILTTGARSLHVDGRAIFLGTAELAPRVLAHEFGHLLGFKDRYFRGYRDRGEEGYEVLEVVPDPVDIMCSAGTGSVLRAHFENLLKALRASQSPKR